MLLRWLIQPKPRETALFRPPEEPATRRDTVDQMIELDRKSVSPAKRAVLGLATAGMAVSSLGNSGIFGGADVEITQVWGAADQYVGPSSSQIATQQLGGDDPR